MLSNLLTVVFLSTSCCDCLKKRIHNNLGTACLSWEWVLIRYLGTYYLGYYTFIHVQCVIWPGAWFTYKATQFELTCPQNVRVGRSVTKRILISGCVRMYYATASLDL